MPNSKVEENIKQINAGYLSVTPSREKRMSNAFPDGYQYMFFQSSPTDNRFSDDAIYIPDLDTTQKLKTFFSQTENTFSFLIGYPGIGKSTVLKNFLNIENNGCILNEKELIIPVFDWDLYSTYSGKCKLYRLLHSVSEELKKITNFSAPRRVSSLETKTSHETHVLKMHLEKAGIRSVVFVLDNLEQLPKEDDTLKKLIHIYQSLIRPDSKDKEPIYHVKMLFSLTPGRFTYAVERGDFHPYKYPFHFIYKTQYINLEKYLNRKRKHPKSPLKNPGEWERFMSSFSKVSQKYDRKYDLIIRGISNYNVNKALLAYADILSNGQWVHPHCKFNEISQHLNEMTVNNISVLRALFCLEDEMFSPLVYSSRLCNFLRSSLTSDSSILTLLIVKLFYRQCFEPLDPLEKKDDSYNMYGEHRHLKKQLVVNFFTSVFSHDHAHAATLEQDVSDTLDYLYQAGILAKCCKVKQGEDHGLGNNSRLFLTPHGRILWEMLANDSVLLELFREDYYRIYEKEGIDHNALSSRILLDKQEQYKLFIDINNLIIDLSQKEREFRLHSLQKKTSTSYLKAFGSDTIISHLYHGLENSVKYAGQPLDEMRSRFLEIENELAFPQE